MKNILRYLLLALVVVGSTVPVFGKAEAAKIAVLPLANNVADDELSGQVFLFHHIAHLIKSCTAKL